MPDLDALDVGNEAIAGLREVWRARKQTFPGQCRSTSDADEMPPIHDPALLLNALARTTPCAEYSSVRMPTFTIGRPHG
jgi:hypothetical protein